MARIRSIKPEFWTDEKVVSLSPLARLLFIGMWNFVDDWGRGEFSPLRMKMQILPADDADSSGLIGEIRRENLISLYAVDGKEYFEVCGFTKHQKVDKRQKSKLPSPPNSPELPRIPSLDQGGDQGKEKEERAEAKASDAVASPARFEVVKDARKELFDEALPLLASYTGKPVQSLRSLVGKWLQKSGDDVLRLTRLIAESVRDQRADPVAWIERSLKPADPDAAIYRNVL